MHFTKRTESDSSFVFIILLTSMHFTRETESDMSFVFIITFTCTHFTRKTDSDMSFVLLLSYPSFCIPFQELQKYPVKYRDLSYLGNYDDLLSRFYYEHWLSIQHLAQLYGYHKGDRV